MAEVFTYCHPYLAGIYRKPPVEVAREARLEPPPTARQPAALGRGVVPVDRAERTASVVAECVTCGTENMFVSSGSSYIKSPMRGCQTVSLTYSHQTLLPALQWFDSVFQITHWGLGYVDFGFWMQYFKDIKTSNRYSVRQQTGTIITSRL